MMIITTKNHITNKQIVKDIKVVTAEATYGIGFATRFMTFICNLIGSKNEMYEKKIKKCKELVLKELVYKAQELGANAIINLKINIDQLTILAIGDAVKVEE